MPHPLIEQLRRRVVVFDGAMGTSTHAYDLDIETDYCGCENCTDVLVKSRPDLVREIHDGFFAAGSEAVYTNTFGGARHVLSEFDLQDDTFTLARDAAALARASADNAAKAAGAPRWVIGSMGPGTKLISLGQIDWDTMLASYREAMAGLIAGGADAIMIETCQDLLQVKCAINAALAAIEDAGKTTDDIAIMVSLTIEQTGTMLVGSSIEAAVRALRGYPIATIGLNCATGPTEMAEHLRYLTQYWDGPITVLPNAGLPVLVEGRTEYPLQPDAFAKALEPFVAELGVTGIGGCCGTTAAHIEALATRFGGRAAVERTTEALPAGCASLYQPTDYRQDNSFLIVGERCNASGSRRFKRMLEEEDWDGVITLARQQVREGSHVLDVNADYAGRDNAADMTEAVRRMARQVDAPLMIDSTQVGTIEAGLRCHGGKCIINSANFEDGEDKFDDICKIARTFNAGLVIGTIDEDPEAAMARTADRKLSIAERAIERATKVHGIPLADIFIDPLVLPISTGMDSDRRSALELINGTRRIAEKYPEVQITCGLSNVSFGLKPAGRAVLNSMLLHELTDAGLTSAIVHASKILPLNKIDDEHAQAALNLIYDRRAESAGGTGLPGGITDADFDPLQAFIDLFADVDSVGESAVAKADLTLEEHLRAHIVDGEKEGLDAALDEAMTKYAPLDIINDHLLDGMKTVGELFGSGRMQLPFVLQSAETMKKAVAHLEPHMERKAGETRGTIVLATVKGDVHDIGKNLVDIILSNNGFSVINLGIKQPINAIIEAFREHKADAVGLSGLLVKSVNVMEDNLKELNTQGEKIPVVLGGAALSRHYAESYLRTVYEGACYYGKDAFDGLRVMDHIVTGRTETLNEEISARLEKRADAEERAAARDAKREAEPAITSGDSGGAATLAAPARSAVARDVDIPTPPFWGTRVVTDIKPDDVYPFINTVALFRGQWQFKKGRMSDAEYAAAIEDTIEPVFERLKQRGRDEAIIEPKVVYGYFPVCSSGDELIIFDPQDHDREIERLNRFPRQAKSKKLCIPDFFRDEAECRELGRKDVLGMSCVTVGDRASEEGRKLFAADDYTEYLYLHGFGVECAEALAELWHKRMRQELGIASDDSPKVRELFTQKYRGSRYSFGYPACPEMADQEILFRLLEPGRIGCELTENWQIDPEQSTSAIIVHHPEAKYFNA